MSFSKVRHPLWSLLCLWSIFIVQLGFCSPLNQKSITTSTFTPPSTPYPTFPSEKIHYVDGNLGFDSNLGSLDQPWQTIKKAVESVQTGDLIYVRGGNYTTIAGGWIFPDDNITISNYPGEQVVIQVPPSKDNYWSVFQCWHTPSDAPNRHLDKRDRIRIIGSDVPQKTLPNGVMSSKGIVIVGSPEQAEAGIWSGIEAAGCDNWEIAGVDFIYVGFGIFQKKILYEKNDPDYATHGWHVHNNRVYGFTREAGLQFNGNENIVENNEIYKILDYKNSPYGCVGVNVLGHNNIVKNNIVDTKSYPNCWGIMLEWDLADENLIENNTLYGTSWNSIRVAGGDNNIIRNNRLQNGVRIHPTDEPGFTDWPCNEPKGIRPANVPSAPDYKYYFDPRECASRNNQVDGNEAIKSSQNK